MEASEEEVLSLEPVYDDKAVKTAQRTLALTYHADPLSSVLDNLNRMILNRRMQEINDAYERVRQSRKDSRENPETR